MINEWGKEGYLCTPNILLPSVSLLQRLSDFHHELPLNKNFIDGFIKLLPRTPSRLLKQQRRYLYYLFTLKLILAVSPLLVLFYIVYSGFESTEAEAAKRKKDDDFVLEGHGE